MFFSGETVRLLPQKKHPAFFDGETLLPGAWKGAKELGVFKFPP